MNLRPLLFGLGLVLASATPAPAQLQPASGVQTSVEAAERGSVRVVAIIDDYGQQYLHSTGSGFVVAPNLVATNAHVAQPARQYSNIRLAIVAPDGSGPVAAEIVRFSAAQDLALLRFTGPSPAPLIISGVDPRPGDAIIALGYPDLDDIERPAVELVQPTAPSRTTGSIAALRDRAPTGQPIPTINHEAAISSGSSGGPLLDECGRVVGINTWHARGRDTLQGRGVATRAAQLRDFLAAWGVSPQISREPCLSAAARAQAERDAALAALNQQNQDISAKLAKADELARVTQMAMIGGIAFFALALATLGIVFFSGRRRAPPALPEAMPARIISDASAALPAPSRPIIRMGRSTPAAEGSASGETPTETISFPPDGRQRSRWPLILMGAAAAAAAALVIPLGLTILGSGGGAGGGSVSEVAGVQDCTFDALASQSPGENTTISIDAQACVDGQTAYAPTTDGSALRRVLLHPNDSAVEVLTLMPHTGEMRRERYVLNPEQLQEATAASSEAPPPQACSTAAREQVARRNAALMRYVSGAPGERTVWRCQRRAS